ncbi:TPA: hypothetical protein ROY01_001342 [Bacillus toyonensis]|nr:hypothetical protein [Bacillus toyonensis]
MYNWADIWQWSKQPGNNRVLAYYFECYFNVINPEDGQAEIHISIK